jgi:hypothetical protein
VVKKNPHLSEALALVPRVSALVDELHLFENGRLSGFTSTKQQHLDLVSQVHFVALQLVLDLLIALLPLLRL